MPSKHAPVHPSWMVTSVRVRALELGAALVAIYALALTCVIRGMPSPGVAVGLTLDLTVTATTATWWLGVTCGWLSRRALFVVFGVGALTARLVLSIEASRLALGIGVGLELIVIAMSAVRARRLIRRMRRDADLPMIIRLADGLEDIGVPRWLARILTTEISTIGLALTGWVRRAPRHGFTVHRTHCSIAIHVVIAGLIVLETIVLHLLLARATVVGAWLATGSSIYALLWLIGDAHALRLGRIRVERDDVVIEIARRWAAVIPRHTIVAVRHETTIAGSTIDLAIETPTVAIELSAPVTARGPFGLTRTGARLALTIDDAAGFVAALDR
jgi:hypothetical protein